MEKYTIRDGIMDGLLALLIGYYVYTIIDRATDGAVSMKIMNMAQLVKERLEHEEIVRRDTGRVLFDAITTIDRATDDTRSDEE